MSESLECLICGRKSKQLHQHLKYHHGITTTEYRTRFGNKIMQIGFNPNKSNPDAYHSNYTRYGYIKINNELDNLTEIYNLEDTIGMLRHDNYWCQFIGKGRHRTMIKLNPRLYKSIKVHSISLPNKFNFKYQIRFLIEYNADINKITCECGNITFTKFCRTCSSNKSRNFTDEYRSKIRNGLINNLISKRGICKPNYNKQSINFIEMYGNENGYSFQHAENGGEFYIKKLGYFVDAYDPINNVVMEIDERHHFKNNQLKENDIKRMYEIINELNCKFIRVKYNGGFHVYFES